MKKLLATVAGLVLVQAMLFAQIAKDPQQELIQAQQKIRSLQAADHQIRSQVSAIMKDQANLKSEVQRSVMTGDSTMKATMDSIRVSNERSLENEKATASLRTSLALQQNLVIIALVLLVCLVLLFLWQRRMLRSLASAHEADIKTMAGKMELQAAEISAKIGNLQDHLSEASRRSEEKIGSVKTLLSDELSVLSDTLKSTAGQIREDHRADMSAEQKNREEGIKGLNLRLAALDEKLDAGLDAAISHMKQETETHRREVSEIRKTLAEVSRNHRGRDNSAG